MSGILKLSLTLTSVFSDSAIFLLRSMQRDECLIPIRASKNVHSEVKEKKRVLGDYQSLQSFDIREFSFTSQIVQFFRNSSTAKKPKTTRGPKSIAATLATEWVGFHGIKVCSPPVCVPGER